MYGENEIIRVSDLPSGIQGCYENIRARLGDEDTKLLLQGLISNAIEEKATNLIAGLETKEDMLKTVNGYKQRKTTEKKVAYEFT